MAAAAGGLTALFVKPFFLRTYRHVSWYDCQTLCNGILSGLVAISASIDRVEPWAAICIGIIAGIIYVLFLRWLVHLEVDDPVEGSAIHMGCGIWGVIAVGFFDN